MIAWKTAQKLLLRTRKWKNHTNIHEVVNAKKQEKRRCQHRNEDTAKNKE